MPAVTIRNLSAETHRALKLRAARNRSVKESREQQGVGLASPPAGGTSSPGTKSETVEPANA